jgi:uncharacterized protein (TIGR02646 family)
VKRVSVVASEPAVLRDFRAANPNATWEQFKTVPGNEAVFDCLAVAQGHICAYCEISISRGTQGQVEHYRPKSGNDSKRDLHLDFANLLAGCEGGTNAWHRDRSEPPILDTMHCGQLKQDKSPEGEMVDPRAIPLSPMPWRTTFQGQLVVDGDGCEAGGIDPELAERTLIFLGLNRRVLVRRRKETMDGLLETHGDGPIEPEILLPDGEGRLQPFWSTVRSFAGPEIEPFILSNGARIPGLS